MMKLISNVGKYTSSIFMDYQVSPKFIPIFKLPSPPVPSSILRDYPLSPKFIPIFKLPSPAVQRNFSTISSWSVSMDISHDNYSVIPRAQRYTDGIDRLRNIFGRTEENGIKCTISTQSSTLSLKSRKYTDPDPVPEFIILTITTTDDHEQLIDVQMRIQMEDVYITGSKLVHEDTWRCNSPLQYGPLQNVHVGAIAFESAVIDLHHVLRKKSRNHYPFKKHMDTICIHISEAIRFYTIEKYIANLMGKGQDDLITPPQIILIHSWLSLTKMMREVMDKSMSEAAFNEDALVKCLKVRFETLASVIALVKAK